MSLQLRIITPVGEVVNETADQVTATGLKGEFGVLPGHIPFLFALKVGPANFSLGNKTRYFALGEGSAEIQNNCVTILTQTAEEATSIDVQRAEASHKRAKERLQNNHPSENSQLRAMNALRRAESRLAVAKFAVEYETPGLVE